VSTEVPVKAIEIESREQWSVVVAKALLKAWSPETLQLVVAGGKEKFLNLGGLYLADQDLKHEDLVRVFNMLSLSAGKVPK
jgi:hypothetical protein